MIQPRQLNLPTQRDPLARAALVALVAAACWLALSTPSVPAAAETALIATPTIGILPTQAPTEAPLPTTMPVVAQAAPTFAPPPTPEPVIVVEQVIVEVTAVPTEAPPTAAPPTEAPAMVIVVYPTPTQTRQEFIDSFGPTPDPNAKCAFIGCLPKP